MSSFVGIFSSKFLVGKDFNLLLYSIISVSFLFKAFLSCLICSSYSSIVVFLICVIFVPLKLIGSFCIILKLSIVFIILSSFQIFLICCFKLSLSKTISKSLLASIFIFLCLSFVSFVIISGFNKGIFIYGLLYTSTFVVCIINLSFSPGIIFSVILSFPFE